jgi:HlyD family secretion protein
MKKNKILILSVSVLVITLGVSVWWFTNQRTTEEQARLVLYGNVDIREVDLAFNNSEHVQQILVQEGERVRKGQLLATLRRSRKLAELNAAEAKVAAQKAVVERLETGSRPEEIAQARADVAAAKAKLNDARITFDRTRRLRKEGAASQQGLDDAQANLQTAEADLDVAEQALALAIEGPREEDIEEAKALLNVDEANLALAREVLRDTELYAPSDGIIRNRILEPGDMASPGIPVFTLALTNPVWVRAYAPETVLGRLAPGMAAEISTDSFPGKSYLGWIGFISPTAEFTPKNVETPELRTRLVYQVRVYACNPQNELRLGMPATVVISLEQQGSRPGQAPRDCAKPAGSDTPADAGRAGHPADARDG